MFSGVKHSDADQLYGHAALVENESSIFRLLQSLSAVVMANVSFMLMTLLTSKSSGWLKLPA